MGFVIAEVADGTAVPPPPEAEQVATTLYRHDCANKDGRYGDKCPDRWSKFCSLEDEEAQLKAEIRNDPIIHRRAFDKDDKKCERLSCSFMVFKQHHG